MESCVPAAGVQVCRIQSSKVPCSYYSTAMGKFALLRYLSES